MDYLKNIIIFLVIIGAVFSMYFGAYQPFVKGKTFISALQSASSIQSIEDFKRVFDPVFSSGWVFGNEEIMKFMGSDIIATLSSGENNFPEASARQLVQYLEEKLIKDDVRHLIIGGQLYGILWARYGGDVDYKKAEEYLVTARQLGPKLPPVLYPLFDLYFRRGDVEKVKEVGGEILKHWPSDQMTQNVLSAL